MENNGTEKVKIWDTEVFSDIISGSNSITQLCNDVIDSMGQFDCLKECGLFTSGLENIIELARG